MHVTMDQAVLCEAFARVQGVVSKKSSLNVLAHALLTTRGSDVVELRATDYDLTLTATYPAVVHKAGAVCVHGADAHAVLKALKPGAVELRADDDDPLRLRVLSRGGKHTLSLIPATSYPDARPVAVETDLELPAAPFAAALGQVVHGMSKEDSRMNLNGVFMVTKERTVSLTTSDGHVLAHVCMDVEKPLPTLEGILFRRGIEELRKLLDGVERVALTWTHKGVVSNDIVVHVGAVQLAIRQLAEEFPAYEKIIPPTVETRAVVDRKELLAAFGRVAVMTNEKVSRVMLDISDGRVALTVQNPERGAVAEAEVACTIDGPAKTTGASIRYLTDALRAMPDEQVRVGVNDEFGPIEFRHADAPEASDVWLVMPLRA